MKKAFLKDLKKGEYFRLKDSDIAPVWVKGYFERSDKKYEIYKFDDVCHESFKKGTTVVYIDFEF